jgi:hypothetical protein
MRPAEMALSVSPPATRPLAHSLAQRRSIETGEKEKEMKLGFGSEPGFVRGTFTMGR